MNVRHWFRVGLLALLVCLAGSRITLVAAPPNIIILLADDLGYGDLGCFGAKGFTTPNLDRMAAEGCRFTNFHVAQAVCSASRAALLTGCYPNRLGIHGALGPKSAVGLSSSETTLAEVLRERGYATGMAGKWHLGHTPPFLPLQHGFEEWFGLPYSNDMWPRHPEAAPGSYPPLRLYDGDRVVKADVTPEDQAQLTTQYTERAVQFLRKNRDRPFFFYLAYAMPHVPLFVSDKFKGRSERGLYGDVVMEIDWSVGEILRTLKELGLDQNTLVLFTSDNGPWLSYGDHAGSAGLLREGKGTAWEGGTRVPCIVRYPGKIPAGSVSGDFLMTIDLLPTFADQAGARLPSLKIDGLDVWPILSRVKGAQNPHSAYFSYYEQNELQAVWSGDGRWKLQLPHTYRTLGGQSGGSGGTPSKYQTRVLKQPELFDLVSDPAEAINVAEANPEVVKRLLVEAEQARIELGDSLTGRVGAGVRAPGKIE